MHKKFSAVLILFALTCSCAWADTTINAENFPDTTFREVVSNYDTNNDGVLQASEISAVETITVRGMGISSLEGIGVFTNLKTLRCSSNNLTALDLSRNTSLESLACDYNQIETLTLSGCRNLREVYCIGAGLKTLDVSGCTALRELYCYTNSLDVLDVSFNTALVSLDCQVNQLTALNTRHNTELEFLDCSTNPLTSLTLDRNTKLKTLYAHDLNLGSSGLDVRALTNLRSLWCWNDGLASLNLSNNTLLESLVCSDNRLDSLMLWECPALSEAVLTGNPIATEIGAVMSANSMLPLTFDSGNGLTLKDIERHNGITSKDITALDKNGNSVELTGFERVDYGKVRAVFASKPEVVRYAYNTGIEGVNLSVSYVSDGAQALAPCENGIFAGRVSGDVLMWKGIPYAKQPVGTLRWKAPEIADNSTEIFDALAFAPTPLQHYSATNPREVMPQGEECLALNVWTKGRNLSTPKPVMVWVHGGSFNTGGTANPEYDGWNFIQAHNDVVLVSVGYRVGMMGFIDFANSGIPGGENYPDSGNLGILDVEHALWWISHNIKAFGGDPDNVTVFGQSSGAALVALMLTRENNHGLFKRAIIESGAVSMTASVAESVPLAQALVQVTSADTMDKLLALSSRDLREGAEKLKALTNFPERDGRILAEDIYSAFGANSGSFDVLTGSTADEVNYFGLAVGTETFNQFVPMIYQQIVGNIAAVSSEDAGLAEQFIGLYMSNNEDASMSEAAAEFLNDLLFRGPVLAEAGLHGGKKYVYYWKYGVPGIGACHAIDIPYIFNDNDSELSALLFNQGLADRVQAMWVNFAKTGNPSASTTWPEYTAGTQSTMIIDEPLSVTSGNLLGQYTLIQPLVMKYRISGREILSTLNNLSGTTPDVTPDPDPTSPDIVINLDRSNGGCNSGFMFPVVLAGMLLGFVRRKS